MGMNKLHAYRVKTASKGPKVVMCDKKGQEVYFHGQRKEKPCSQISSMKAS